MTKTIKYSIPYNGDLELIKWAIQSEQVYEIYFAGPLNQDFSSADKDSHTNTESEIGALIDLCAKSGIERNFLLNKSILFFDNVKDIISCIKSLEKYGGVTSVTIADPLIVPYLVKAFPNINIQSSVFLHIDTANKIREAWKMGIKSFCLDISTNRNGLELEKIRDLKKHYPEMTIKLLANHGCFQHCFYAQSHEKWIVFRDLNINPTDDKYILGNIISDVDKCHFKVMDLEDEIKRSFIRPEDVKYYEENCLTDYLKICYRMDKSPVLKTTMKAYFERSFDGDLLSIVPSNKGTLSYTCQNKEFPNGFAKKVIHCNFDCENCHYCEKVSAKVFKNKAI